MNIQDLMWEAASTAPESSLEPADPLGADPIILFDVRQLSEFKADCGLPPSPAELTR